MNRAHTWLSIGSLCRHLSDLRLTVIRVAPWAEGLASGGCLSGVIAHSLCRNANLSLSLSKRTHATGFFQEWQDGQ